MSKNLTKTQKHTHRATPPTHYSITASMCHSIAHRAPSWAQSHTSPLNYAGRRRGGAKISGLLVNGSSHANCGAFSISIYCFITTWPRLHLQPSTLFFSFNFNPRRHFIPLQLQSSLPTSSLVAANFNPRRCAISSPSP
jgi:hypothetical protein